MGTKPRHGLQLVNAATIEPQVTPAPPRLAHAHPDWTPDWFSPSWRTEADMVAVVGMCPPYVEDFPPPPPFKRKPKIEYDREADLAFVVGVLKRTKPEPGTRNNTAFRMAALCRDHAITPERALSLLYTWNDKNDIGLPDHEIEHVVGSAQRYARNKVGSAIVVEAKDDFAGVEIDPKWLPPVEEVLATAEKRKKRRNRFAGMNLDQLENLPPLQWLIDGILPKGQLVELYGPPKAGKTFVAIDMGLCIATGRPYHGKATIKGRVLHIVAEGNKAAIRDRAKAWIIVTAKDADERKQLEADVRANWILVGVPVHINEPGILQEFFAANPGKFDLVIVDTLLRNMAGHISDPKDMAEFVRACDAIRDRYGAAVLVVHHEGKDRSKGGMGSIALDAAVDAILIFRREGAKRTLTVKEVRDGSSDLPDLIFELQVVTLSVDPDTLKSVTSAALKLTGTKAKVGLSAAMKLLRAIHMADKPSSAGLAATLGVGKPAISKFANELRELGMLSEKGWTLTPHGIETAEHLAEEG